MARGSTGRVAALLVGAVALIAACSSGGEDDATGDTGRVGPDAPGAAAEEAGGGVLRIGMEQPASLAPSDASLADPTELILADLLHDTLTEIVGAEAVPGLATFSANADATSWTFTLADRSFAGGRAITSTDVKQSIERVAAGGSPAGLRLEVVDGWDDFVAGRAAELVGVVAVDPTTVRIDTVEPFAVLPHLLANPVFGIAASEAVGESGAPLGSGSFVVSMPEPDLLRLEPLERAEVLVDAIEVRLFAAERDAFVAFAEGEVDLAPVPTDAAGIGDDPFPPFHGLLYLGFNDTLDLFAKPGLREAVARAIDRAALARTVYGPAASALERMIPEAAGGTAEDPCAGVCDTDVAAAADLVRFIYPEGDVPTIRLDVEVGERNEALAALIEADLEAVGIPIEVRTHSFEELEQLVGADGHELFVFGWIVPGPAAELTIDPLFSSESLDNVTAFADADVDFLLGAVGGETDPAERNRIVAELEQRLADRLPVVPLVQFRSLVVTSPRVQGYAPDLDGTFDAGAVWVGG